MSKRIEYNEPDGRVIILHFQHWLPRFLGWLQGARNLCITINRKRVLIQRDWIGQKGLAHECAGHVPQAHRLGWRYLPWVLWTYVRYGYAKSPAEIEADEAMEREWRTYPSIGNVPSWVVER